MDGGIREIDSNGEVIAPAIFFMERLDVVARASGEEDGHRFLGGILCPLADGSVASDRGNFGLRGGGIGGAEPEFGLVIGGDIKSVISGERWAEVATGALAVIASRIGAGFEEGSEVVGVAWRVWVGGIAGEIGD